MRTPRSVPASSGRAVRRIEPRAAVSRPSNSSQPQGKASRSVQVAASLAAASKRSASPTKTTIASIPARGMKSIAVPAISEIAPQTSDSQNPRQSKAVAESMIWAIPAVARATPQAISTAVAAPHGAMRASAPRIASTTPSRSAEVPTLATSRPAPLGPNEASCSERGSRPESPVAGLADMERSSEGVGDRADEGILPVMAGVPAFREFHRSAPG